MRVTPGALILCGLAGAVTLAALVWMSSPVWGYALACLAWGLAGTWWTKRRKRLVREAVTSAQAPSAPLVNLAAESARTVLPVATSVDEQESLRYAISHDLRAPLRAVNGFTRTLKEDYGHQLDVQAHQYLDRVLMAADRMDGMIEALLAQVQMASVPLERQTVDMSALIHDIARDHWGSVNGSPDAGLKVSEGMVAQADPVLLRRVLENLIGNALKYSSKAPRAQVSVGVLTNTNPQVFYVRDNGVGFDMKRADKLFGMFQRLHSVKDFPGTGVGLAAVRQIVQRHGGRIWAESEVGQGACFYFTLDASLFPQRRADR